MADKKKFPNPAFFRARTEMDWKAQAANLKEVGSIALELIKETDWKAFGKKQDRKSTRLNSSHRL